MPSFKIEMDGDGDRDIMDFAVRQAARRHYVCEVMLGPTVGRNIPSVADYILSNHCTDRDGRDRVTLTLWDNVAEKAYTHPDGSNDVNHALVDDIWELKIY